MCLFCGRTRSAYGSPPCCPSRAAYSSADVYRTIREAGGLDALGWEAVPED
jgi:hypothetical protein